LADVEQTRLDRVNGKVVECAVSKTVCPYATSHSVAKLGARDL
jgi:hypothetical protein